MSCLKQEDAKLRKIKGSASPKVLSMWEQMWWKLLWVDLESWERVTSRSSSTSLSGKIRMKEILREGDPEKNRADRENQGNVSTNQPGIFAVSSINGYLNRQQVTLNGKRWRKRKNRLCCLESSTALSKGLNKVWDEERLVLGKVANWAVMLL